MKKYPTIIITIISILSLAACGQSDISGEKNTITHESTEIVIPSVEENAAEESCADVQVNTPEYTYIDAAGMTLETRIVPPQDYERVSVEEGSFADFLRKYSVKEDGSPVLLYNGENKGNQSAHAAVLNLPLENENLQQCADSVMRMYAEYFWATEQYERIAFHFTNGFLAEYTKWREGYRISVDGNQVSWKQSANYDDSYDTFMKFMRIVFAYAGTLSMEQEAKDITLEEIQSGDVFLMGGSPGHVVMIMDVSENEQGEKAFLLAQGYMPAQEFHILKNPAHEDNPWYYESEITYPLQTPEYIFSEGSLKRLNY